MTYSKEISRFAYPKLFKAIIVFAGLILGFLTARFFFLPFTVCDDSMLPNFKKGESVYILKHISPKIGDIVLLQNPVQPDMVMLKRVVGLDGNFIEIRNKIIYKNNDKMKFTWKINSTDNRIFPMNFSSRDNLPAVKIERKMFFVIGDNLDYSFDSRSFGPISEKLIIGKVIYKGTSKN
jgi:signal peptidase I